MMVSDVRLQHVRIHSAVFPADCTTQGELEKRKQLLEKRCKLLREERELLQIVRGQVAGDGGAACIETTNSASMFVP